MTGLVQSLYHTFEVLYFIVTLALSEWYICASVLIISQVMAITWYCSANGLSCKLSLSDRKTSTEDMLEFKQNWKLIWIRVGFKLSSELMITDLPVPPKNKRSNVPLYFVFSGGNKRCCMVLLEQWLEIILFYSNYYKENIQKEIKIKYKGTASSRLVGSFTWAIQFAGELRRNQAV